MRIARRGLEKFIEVFRERGESLLVIGLASETGNGDVVWRGLRRPRAESGARGAKRRQQRGSSQ
jgi:hypothetical protein